MNCILENESLKVTINTHGAELQSIKSKKTENEYLWNGDPKGWEYRAPVLFPVIGRVYDNKFKIDDKVYDMGLHGFARDREFEILSQNKTEISFIQNYTEDSLKIYPYKFSLIIRYFLEGTSIKTEYEVVNKDTKEIYFSIGGHPAFNCPVKEGESFEDYYLEFEKKETADKYQLTEQGHIKREKLPFFKDQNIINLKKEIFFKDALIFEKLNSNKVSLKSKKSSGYLTVDFKKQPFLGIWTPPFEADFICIEPWHGHADFTDFRGDYREKEDNVKLSYGETFKTDFTITITE